MLGVGGTAAIAADNDLAAVFVGGAESLHGFGNRLAAHAQGRVTFNQVINFCKGGVLHISSVLSIVNANNSIIMQNEKNCNLYMSMI